MVSDIDLNQLDDDTKSIAEGAITIPGYKVDSWWTVGIFTESGFVDPNKPIRKYTKQELHDFLYKEPTKVSTKPGAVQPVANIVDCSTMSADDSASGRATQKGK